MADVTKIKLRIEQYTNWGRDYESGKVITRLLVDGREAYEDKREFGKDGSETGTRSNAADDVTELLAAALGRLMRAEREQADGEG